MMSVRLRLASLTLTTPHPHRDASRLQLQDHHPTADGIDNHELLKLGSDASNAKRLLKQGLSDAFSNKRGWRGLLPDSRAGNTRDLTTKTGDHAPSTLLAGQRQAKGCPSPMTCLTLTYV